MKHIQLFENFNESSTRVTWGEEEVHELNDEPINLFIKKYEGKKNDIFFTTDGKAIVTGRMANLSYHGKDSGKNIKGNNIKFVYCTLENEFYSLDDFKKLLRSVYNGSRPRIKPLDANEIH